ncbi:uncharacterized protein LOC113367234 [Ctenocephalides felis]|uniref:uncharacterized protein LOC113367234 n=1 Tax=Ctenocephalides felis TaxID=7515 RepID=UPI000E6E39CD|nr:uncharacterized protein LOC113367234 [Ctenocephalides felis]
MEKSDGAAGFIFLCRHLKESRRIGSACPSRIISTLYDDGHVVVDYWKTHVGHEKLAKYVPIDKNLLKDIREKIIAGVNDDVIIGTIREACYRKTLPERASLISKKDLWNIKKKVIPSYTPKCKDDTVSVRMWLEEMRSDNRFIIVFHKEVGPGTAKYGLQDEDYILIIMTKMQCRMLKKFGTDRVCIDGTHGTNGYGYLLQTLLVVDEFGSGIPVAFCFSNRQDEFMCKIFFEEIYKVVGILKTKVFMTDDAPAYFNAWSSVMGVPQHKLLCSWHVSRSWKRSVSNKILNREKREVIYQKLIELKMILDEDDFWSNLNSYLNELEKDDDAKLFVKYFKKFYYSRATTWAYCYRKGLGINTNMFLESFHNQMKTRRTRRINGTLLSTRQRDVRVTHVRGAAILPHRILECIPNTQWNVFSTEDNVAPYVVTKINPTCNSTCMRCESCKICLHTYSCSCIDYLIRSNICKHIHACVKVFPSDTGYRRELLEKDMLQKSLDFKNPENFQTSTKDDEEACYAIIKQAGQEIMNLIQDKQFGSKCYTTHYTSSKANTSIPQ